MAYRMSESERKEKISYLLNSFLEDFMTFINHDAPPSKSQAVLGYLIIQPVSNFCRKPQKLYGN